VIVGLLSHQSRSRGGSGPYSLAFSFNPGAQRELENVRRGNVRHLLFKINFEDENLDEHLNGVAGAFGKKVIPYERRHG
jgi:hypothetical protein